MSVHGFVGYLRGELEITDGTLILAACLGYEYGKREHDNRLKDPRKDDIFFNVVNENVYRYDGERWVED